MAEAGKGGAGGYIPGKGVPVVLHPEECVIRAADVEAGIMRCSRRSHEGRDCQVTPGGPGR